MYAAFFVYENIRSVLQLKKSKNIDVITIKSIKDPVILLEYC